MGRNWDGSGTNAGLSIVKELDSQKDFNIFGTDFYFLGLKYGTGLGQNWDGTGTRLKYGTELGRDWDEWRTKYCKRTSQNDFYIFGTYLYF